MPVTETTIRLANAVPGCEPCGCGPSGPVVDGVQCCPDDSIPETLYLTDPNGTITFNYFPDGSTIFNVAAGQDGWGGCYTKSVEGSSEPDCDTKSTVTTALRYLLICININPGFTPIWRWQLIVTGAPCMGPPTAPYVYHSLPIEWDCTTPIGEGDVTPVGVGPVEPLCFSCDPFLLEFDLPSFYSSLNAVWGTSGEQVKVFISDAPSISRTVEVCLTARSGCRDTGDVIAGADVAWHKADGTAMGTDVTDAGGEACKTFTRAGAYYADVVKDGCTVRVPFVIGPCGDVDPIQAVFCCDSVAAVQLIDDETDAPIEGGEVDFEVDGLVGTVATGADGIASRSMTPAEMLTLAVSGGDCDARTVPISAVRAENIGPAGEERTYFYRCDQETVATCGVSDPTPTMIRLRKIPLGTTIDEACCGPIDCTAIGPTGRAVRYDQLDTRVRYRPRTKAGTVIFDILLDDYIMSIVGGLLPGQHIWRGPCFNLPTPVVLPNACEFEPGVFSDETWRSVKAEVELCTGTVGILRIWVYRGTDCTILGGSEALCPGCEADPLYYETPLDMGAAVGSRTDRVCWGESISLNRTDTDSLFCDILTEFDAVGIAA